MNKHKDKSILGILLTALVLCALVVLVAMPTPASAAENVWTEMTSRTETWFHKVWGSAADDVFVLSSPQDSKDYILHYNGSNWTDMAIPLITSTDIQAKGIWGSAADDVFVVGSILTEEAGRQGIILHYNGTSWSKMDIPPGTLPGRWNQLKRVWGSAADDVFAFGYSTEVTNVEYALLHYDGSKWTRIPLPDEFNNQDLCELING